jgi:hypothetical protein
MDIQGPLHGLMLPLSSCRIIKTTDEKVRSQIARGIGSEVISSGQRLLACSA